MKKSFDFTGKFKYFFSASLIIIIIGLVFNVIYGAKLDINFKGGSQITYEFEGSIDTDKVASVIEEETELEVDLSINENYASSTKSIVIAIVGEKAISTEQLEQIEGTLNKNFEQNKLKFANINSVDAPIGFKFFQKSIYALLLASVFVVAYIGIRFRNIGGISAAISALFALFHDVILVYFITVMLRLPIDDNFFAVILTILGYSLNDTIVIYDRVRENNNLYGNKMTKREIVNASIKQTLGRTIVTSIATFVSIMCVTVIAAFSGLDSILSFSIPMSIGIIAGSYSSIFLAGPLYVLWSEFKDKHNIGKKSKKSNYVGRKNPKNTKKVKY